MARRLIAPLTFACLSALAATARSEPLPIVSGVDAQPFAAGVRRVVQALELLGSPLEAAKRDALDKALDDPDPEKRVQGAQAVLDPLCLVGVNINPESRVKVAQGEAPAELIQQGWRVFLVKVHNEAGVTAEMRCTSPNAAILHKRSTASPEPARTIKPSDVADRWMDVSLPGQQPLAKGLSGLPLEYRLMEVYSRDVGQREAKFMFDVGQGTQDLGFRNEVNVLFECDPSVEVVLEILDFDGKPTTGQFVIRDGRGRLYPSLSRRMAPDFFFHEQIYRHSGESVMLPAGTYQVTFTRGPEHRIMSREITVPPSVSHKEKFQLERWIHMADRGWISGDHHVHAAGCAHYESPAEGVLPVDMMRHILGEDLNVGCVLSWGPCWYYQKQFFEGGVSKLSSDRYVMRYDVEVSGFPSSHTGHLCLLNLKEDDYPGTTRIEEWPSWDLPVLQWGKSQGAVVGFSHSGWGLKVSGDTLPTYEMPPFDGIGANEYVVDVVHGACDFISTVDTPAVWELNVWYHTLNCGYTCRISGETDFPCIYGERVGLGRVYVKSNDGGPVDYDSWVEGVRDGRSYVSDGLSHLFDFKVNDLGVGEPGDGKRPSVVAVASASPLSIRAKAAALLADNPRDDIRGRPLDQKPYWHVERARIGDSAKVPVELIVNGRAVERKEITADGSMQEVAFTYQPKISSWVALRIFPSSHTNPVFVEVGGKPIRASRKSAEWCRTAVDVCWEKKMPNTRPADRDAAQKAYDVAREAYDKIITESQPD
jgi:hypothetical protein